MPVRGGCGEDNPARVIGFFRVVGATAYLRAAEGLAGGAAEEPAPEQSP